MPQLDPSTFTSQIFWLAITFAVLYLLMARFALPAVSGVLQNRKERIAGDLDKAEELSVEAGELEATYLAELAELQAEAQAIIAESFTKSKKKSEAKHAELDKALLLRLKDAEARIVESADKVLGDVAEVATDLSVYVTKQVAGAKVDLKTARKVVDAVIK